eukprot:5973979-Alexandrium_andersonii.AAC.1
MLADPLAEAVGRRGEDLDGDPALPATIDQRKEGLERLRVVPGRVPGAAQVRVRELVPPAPIALRSGL